MSANKRGGGLQVYMNSPLFGGGDARMTRSPGAARERAIEYNLERNLAELAMNRFRWEGFPDSVDVRFLELQLLFSGVAVCYWDRDFDKLVVTQGSGFGYVNYTNNYTSYNVIAPGSRMDTSGTQFIPKIVKAYMPQVHSDAGPEKLKRLAVGIWPNYLRSPDIDTVQIFATRLATTDRTLEINAKNARRNKIVTATSNNQLSLVNVSRQMDEGVEQILVKEGANIEDAISAIDLGIDAGVFDKLKILRNGWWNDCMTLLGIDSANQDKKERLVADEVGANNAQADAFRHVALQARQQAAEQINHVFGVKVTVDYNVEVEAQAKAMAAANGISSEDNK